MNHFSVRDNLPKRGASRRIRTGRELVDILIAMADIVMVVNGLLYGANENSRTRPHGSKADSVGSDRSRRPNVRSKSILEARLAGLGYRDFRRQSLLRESAEA
jgi:hypothetical protein